MTRFAFTLVETLSVVVLIALGAAVVLASLEGDLGSSSIGRDLRWQIGAADRAARLASLGGSYAFLESEGDSLVVRDSDGLELFRTGPLLPRASVRIECPALAASSTVRFDPAGRSDDYEIIVSTANGSIRVRVSGFTGWINDCQEAHE